MIIERKTTQALAGLAVCLLLAGTVTLAAEGDTVDLNRAGVEELSTLPGVGPVIAGRIVNYREEQGRFGRIEDLLNVRGIGEKKFLQLRDRVSVQEPEEAVSQGSPDQ